MSTLARRFRGAGEPADSFVLTDSAQELSQIRDSETDVAIWRRRMDPAIQEALDEFVADYPAFNIRGRFSRRSPDLSVFTTHFEQAGLVDLVEEQLEALIDQFAALTDAPEFKARLELTDKQNCPKFHVDHVHLRLLSTLAGPGTEWVCREDVREIRRHSSCRDHLHAPAHKVRWAERGDVVVLKGRLASPTRSRDDWSLHRSPQLKSGEARLVFKLTAGHTR
ncbi:MAG: DUF1826 domain-containing protein [Persicimonas sp.]